MPLPSSRTIALGWSAHHQDAAAGAMNAACELYGPEGAGTYDPSTMSTTASRGPAVWAGACRVQASGSQAAVGDQAGQEVTVHDYLVELDETHDPTPTGVAVGWAVKVIAAANDASLVGRVLDVADVPRASERFTRVLLVDDNEG